jgi:hypothetical protein
MSDLTSQTSDTPPKARSLPSKNEQRMGDTSSMSSETIPRQPNTRSYDIYTFTVRRRRPLL